MVFMVNGLMARVDDTEFVIAGLVLLAVVLVDALSKRSRAPRGLD
jgi:hypothetical protein